MTEANEDVSSLYGQVHKRLVETGEWDRILLTLARKLNESGWLDDTRNQFKESATMISSLNFPVLFAQVRPQTATSVPLAIKTEVETMIRLYLETQFEN